MDKPLVLIVEDERDAAALYRFVVEMTGYRAEIAFHGQAAVERLLKIQPEIVILDLNLPGVPGQKILEMIRQDVRLRSTKVFVVTGQSNIDSSLPAEPDLVLYKPIKADQLSTLLRRFIMKERLQKTIPIRADPWDKITGVYNRSYFVNRLDSLLKQTKESDRYLFAVQALDLDPNNKIEKQFSTADWESILQKTGKSLKSAIRPTDTIARFYQNEFYCLIENIPNEAIPVAIASRLHQRLNEALSGNGDKTKFMIRIGILLCDSGYEKIEEILRDAGITQSLANAQAETFYKYYDRVSLRSVAAD